MLLHTVNLYHWLGFEDTLLAFAGYAGAEASGEEDEFHIISNDNDDDNDNYLFCEERKRRSKPLSCFCIETLSVKSLIYISSLI